MKQIKTLIKAPLLTQSGYGVHSRLLFRALFKDPLFDVYAENINWGACSFLTEDTEEKHLIKHACQKHMMAKHKGQDQYDLFIHVSIPNEFQKLGTVNVGVTAGIETDKVSHVWVQKCNEMDLVIVPSEHARKGLAETVVEWHNPQTNERGTFKLDKPIVVCPEGIDTSIFRAFDYTGEEKDQVSNLEFESDFNFLHVGTWGKGGYGEDRKNIANLVKYFIEAFKGRRDVGLVLKVSMAKNSITDFNGVKDRLNQIKSNYKEEEVPPIYLLHANLTDQEMASLYNHPKIKSFISLTHGECWGLPLNEAAACGLPIVATNWSGHLDFLQRGKFSAVDYDLVEIPKAAVWDGVLIEGSKWAAPKEEDAKRRMKKIVSSYSKPKEWAKELADHVSDNFDIDVVGQQFTDTLKQLLKSDQAAPKLNPSEQMQAYVDTPDSFNVLYTMPMSTGDVYISTAVIDGLAKELPEGFKIYFATSPQYADLLKGNPHIHKIIPWQQYMMNVDLTESVFDLVLTPNVATQYNFSNWVRRGSGKRLLAEEFANHCQVELGDYFIEKDYSKVPDCKNYMTLHTTSGKGQWEGRAYEDWKEVIHNLKKYCPDLSIVQVGQPDEDLIEGVDIDLRGKTNYQELAGVLDKSLLHLSPDSFTMHLGVSLGTPVVALFGCSSALHTGPWVKDKENAKFILLQSDRLSGCGQQQRFCYKNRCAVNPDGNGPICEIDGLEVFQACARLLKDEVENEAK